MIRLIISVLVNIIFMPRIDYSYLVEPVQSLGTVFGLLLAEEIQGNLTFRFST